MAVATILRTLAGRGFASAAAWALTVTAGAGCATTPAGPPAAAPAGVSSVDAGPVVDFDFDSLDDRPLSSESTRGKVTVLAFVTTDNLPSQAQVDFLVPMARRDGDRARYGVVALDGRENREIVELYAKSLAIPFPVAMADAATLAGAGPFGAMHAVPVTVLLDREGRVVWRVEGRVAKSDEIRAAMSGL